MQVNAGSGLELQAITAVIVGGVSVFGGSGTILGVTAACILLGAITNGIAVLGYSAFLQETVFGSPAGDRGGGEFGESPVRPLALARPAGAEVVRWRLILGDLAGAREAVTFALLAIAFTIFSFASPYFLGSLTFSFILTNSVEIGLIALTMTIVMVMGEIDLSVGSIVGLAAAMLGAMVTHGVPFVLAIVIALATGLVAGLFNAALCIGFGLPSRGGHARDARALPRHRGARHRQQQQSRPFPSWFGGWNTEYAFGMITYPQISWFVAASWSRSSCSTGCGSGRHVSFIGSNPRARALRGHPRQPHEDDRLRGLGPDVGGCRR